MSARRRVELHHVNVWDDGMRSSLGAPYLISYASQFQDIRDRYDLVGKAWETGGPVSPEGIVQGSAPKAEEIAASVIDANPFLVGFTLVQWTEKVFLDAATLIKRARPEITVAVGGPLATDCGTELVGDRPIDLMVRGYGERPFAALLRGLAGDPPYALQNIPGLYFRAGNDWLGMPPDGESAGVLAEVPSVYRAGLVDLDRIRKLHVEWSRGCPFACAYCSWGMGNRKLYFAPHEAMVDDIRFAREHGIRDVVLNCSAINFSTPKLGRYIDAMKEGDPEGEVAFTAFIMYEALQPEQLELFSQVNFRTLCMGLQTDEEEGRQIVHRPRFDRERFEWAVTEIAKFTRPGVSIISGIPGDTRDKFRARLEYLLDNLDCDITVFPLQVPPGTPMWQHKAELGIEPDAKRQYWVYETPTLSAEEHLDCVKYAAARLDATRRHPRGFERHSHGVSTTNDFFDGVRERGRGGKTSVLLYDTKVFDGGVNVGLGVPFLISHARRRPAIAEKYELEAKSFPMQFYERPGDAAARELANEIAENPPKILGLSLQCWSADLFQAVITRVKRRTPDIVTVAGGPTATDLGAELMEQCPELDFVVSGFAEHAFADLLEALQEPGPLMPGERFDPIAELFYRDEHGEIKKSRGHAPVLADLDECGAPIQDELVPCVSELDILNVEWTRGCPLACSFCTWPLGQRKLTRFSNAYVERDIAWAIAAGFQEVRITDAAINFKTESLRKLVEAITRADPERKLEFDAFLQYYCLDEEQSELLHRVRFKRLMLGLQTDDDAGLEALHRPKFDRDEFERSIAWVKPTCDPIVDLMTAVPGDTAEKILHRLDYLLGLDCRVSVFPTLALPGTELFARRAEYGLEVDAHHMYIVRSLPTLSEADYRRVLEEIQARVDGGAPIELSGYRILEGSDAARPSTRTESVSLTMSREELAEHTERIVRRLARVNEDLKSRLGILGFSPYTLSHATRAGERSVRVEFRAGEQSVRVEAFDVRLTGSPTARGRKLAFEASDGSELGRLFCQILARLDRGAPVDRVSLEVAR